MLVIKNALLDITLDVATICQMEVDQHMKNTNIDDLDLVDLFQEKTFCQYRKKLEHMSF